MTTPVVTMLAALLGDDVDHSHDLRRDGQTVVGPGREWVHSCRLPRDAVVALENSVE